MGGHHHGHPDIPDYKIYKVENVPELKELQQKLAARGLKDPWLRNEVWRFPKYTTGQFLNWTILRGWKWGVALGIVTTGLEYLWEHNRTLPGDHHKQGEAHHH